MVLGRDGEPSLRIDVTVFGLLGHDLIMAPRMADLGDGAGVVSAVGRVTSVSVIRLILEVENQGAT